MAFTWDGRFILRRVEETDTQFHRIYLHSADPADITSALNVIDWAPTTASKARFEAKPVEASSTWEVKLAGVNGTVLVGVFQLSAVMGGV